MMLVNWNTLYGAPYPQLWPPGLGFRDMGEVVLDGRCRNQGNGWGEEWEVYMLITWYEHFINI